MPGSVEGTLLARCRCGGVTVEARGAPILAAICYCDDCQAGSRQIEALPGGEPLCGRDGGTSYVLYRKDRVRCVGGGSLLKPCKLRPASATHRLVAGCCNTGMHVGFDDARHWVSLYRARLPADAGAPQMRVNTRFKPAGAAIPDDIPSYRRFPPMFVAKLVAARIGMLIGR